MMKKLLLTAILVLTHIAFAAPGKTVVRLTPEQAKARVERSTTFKEITKAREAGKDITADPKLMEKVTKMLELNLKELVTTSAADNSSMVKLININAKDTMAEVARLSSIAKDASSKPEEVTMAKKSIELMIKAANTVGSLAVNSAEATKQQETVKTIIEVSNKIASLNFGEASTKFIEKYETALREGKSVEDAVKEASNGKFALKELRECE